MVDILSCFFGEFKSYCSKLKCTERRKVTYVNKISNSKENWTTDVCTYFLRFGVSVNLKKVFLKP